MASRLRASLVIGSAFLAALAGATIAATGTNAALPAAPAVEPYVPGLGDFMTAYVQPHHIKLWFAASAGDWKLAAYEANELDETFEDISTYQATWKSVPVAQLVKAIIEPPLKNLDAAIAAKDLVAFKTAYGTLTAACNSCHTRAQHDFLTIKIPTANPFSDQAF
jgi:hypothetical protein